MGNCMETEKVKEESNIMKIGDKEVKFVKDVENNNSKGIRVKMVLTKEELQWLMLQLRNRSESGVTCIEDVLVEIEKARKRVMVDNGWKPSLDSITEIPEVVEMNR